MKNNLKFLFFFSLLAALFSCSSIPRTMGPYIETEVKNRPQLQAQTQAQTQTQTQAQPQTQPQQSKPLQPQTQQPQTQQPQPNQPQQPKPQQPQSQQSQQPQQPKPPQQQTPQEVEVEIKVVVGYEQPQPQPKPQLKQEPQQDPPQNVNMREEKLYMASDFDEQNLKRYNIIIGSFSVEANAKNLAKSLKSNYNAFVVVNEKGMFRVIIASFDNYNTTKEELEKSIKYKFPDAWILAQKKIIF